MNTCYYSGISEFLTAALEQEELGSTVAKSTQYKLLKPVSIVWAINFVCAVGLLWITATYAEVVECFHEQAEV